ncbi:MAG: transposase [Burkholderiales bacterium]|nr:transposase [Burkholderiales bacterium]
MGATKLFAVIDLLDIEIQAQGKPNGISAATDYKLFWRGGWLIEVPAKNTSRACLECDHVSADNRKSQALFKGVACGFEEHTNVVGANKTGEATSLSAKVGLRF